MLLRRSTDIRPKELARDMRGFFNSLLGDAPSRSEKEAGSEAAVYGLWKGEC